MISQSMGYSPRPIPQAVAANIGFRVEFTEVRNRFYNESLDPAGGMYPRTGSVSHELWWDACHSHLSWDRQRATPFISMFRTWERVTRWRKHMLLKGARDAVIIAVWLKGKPGIYDAHDMAIQLGYDRETVRNHEGELLLQGHIDSEEGRILAFFRGDSLSDDSNVRLSPLSKPCT